MHKKIPLVIGIAILFLGTCITLSVAIDNPIKPISSGNTLYVGGTGPKNYTSIQEAVDDAKIGDTVFVYNDSSPYIENVVIDKPINLIGEDKNSTMIHGGGSGDVLLVSAYWVNIKELNIRKMGKNSYGIHIFSNYNKIKNNIISGYRGRGIGLERSNGNNISSNNFFMEGYSIVLNNSKKNSIYDNYIHIKSYTVGIRLFSSSNNNIVSENTIFDGDIGILLFSPSNNNIISENTIFDCARGIEIIGHYNDINNN